MDSTALQDTGIPTLDDGPNQCHAVLHGQAANVKPPFLANELVVYLAFGQTTKNEARMVVSLRHWRLPPATQRENLKLGFYT